MNPAGDRRQQAALKGNPLLQQPGVGSHTLYPRGIDLDHQTPHIALIKAVTMTLTRWSHLEGGWAAGDGDSPRNLGEAALEHETHRGATVGMPWQHGPLGVHSLRQGEAADSGGSDRTASRRWKSLSSHRTSGENCLRTSA